MGIKFVCPNGHRLHVKADLAGKTGICPECQARVVIPALPQPDTAGSPSVPPPLAAAAVPPAPAAVEAATSASDAKVAAIWYARSAAGESRGPATAAQVQQWFAEGLLDEASWIWRSGWADWKAGREVGSSLFEAVAAGSSVPGPPPTTPQGSPASSATRDPWAALPQEDPQLGARLVSEGSKTGLGGVRQSRRQRRRRERQLTMALGLVALALAATLAAVLVF
jgi:hypothetical protein